MRGLATRARWLGLGFLLLFGCTTPELPSVFVDRRVEARLVTRQRHGIFLTTVRIGDREAGPFALDTGSNQLVLDGELARTLGLRERGAGQDRATGRRVTFVTIPMLHVGRVVMRNTLAGVDDLSALTPAVGERLAGVLGSPFFAHAVVEFDYGRRTVSCFAPGTYALADEHWQPLRIDGERPVMTGRLDGHNEGRFLLDTASTATLHLAGSFLQKHVAIDIRDVRRTKEVRVSGEHEALEGTIGAFEFGGQRFERLRITFRREPYAVDVDATSGLDGIVGGGLLGRFVVVFDYAAARIALLRKP